MFCNDLANASSAAIAALVEADAFDLAADFFLALPGDRFFAEAAALYFLAGDIFLAGDGFLAEIFFVGDFLAGTAALAGEDLVAEAAEDESVAAEVPFTFSKL